MQISWEGGNGIANGGGTGLYKSVVDGDTSSYSQHSIYKFPLFARVEHR